MSETVENHDDDYDPNKLYDRSELTYANSFPSRTNRILISAIEILTARYYLVYKMRKWERDQNKDPDFWISVLNEMNIELTTPKSEIARIPSEGPLVIVSNHPHGLIDGIVMARLISQSRDDYQILTRALLVGVTRIEKYLLPVSFPHEEDAVRKNIQMRQKAIGALKDGHCIALFPAGTEIRNAFNKKQSPVIGELIDPEIVKSYEKDANGLMAFLREETLKLKPKK